MFLSKSRGQAFSLDFVASVVIFLVIFIMVNALWGSIWNNAAEQSARGELAAFAFALSENAVRSQGSPANWNSTTVESAGFATENYLVLDSRKLLEFMELNYSMQKDALSTRGYGFYLRLWNEGGTDYSGVIRAPAAYYSYCDSGLLSPIQSSGIEWDYYWGGSGNCAEPGHDGAGYYYAGTKVAALNALLLNQSEYATIVIEAPGLSEALRSSINLSALDEFVESGGILFYAGDGAAAAPLIEENFSMGFEYDALGRSGAVSSPSFLLKNAEIGEEVVMAASNWAVKENNGEELVIVVADSGDADAALAGYWEYGAGAVYYLADYNASFEFAGGGAGVFNAIGWPLEYGEEAPGSSNAFVVNRMVAIENVNRRRNALTLTVWELVR